MIKHVVTYLVECLYRDILYHNCMWFKSLFKFDGDCVSLVLQGLINFAYGSTAGLVWHVQKSIVIWFSRIITPPAESSYAKLPLTQSNHQAILTAVTWQGWDVKEGRIYVSLFLAHRWRVHIQSELPSYEWVNLRGISIWPRLKIMSASSMYNNGIH